MGWIFKKLGFDPWQVQEIHSFSKTSISSLGPTESPVQWVLGTLSLGISKSWREADHLPYLLERLRMSGGLPPLLYMPLCTFRNNLPFSSLLYTFNWMTHTHLLFVYVGAYLCA
jgi:hypothetical protein